MVQGGPSVSGAQPLVGGEIQIFCRRGRLGQPRASARVRFKS
jgi:hypothetical protein